MSDPDPRSERPAPCPRCGHAPPADASEGLCPRCLSELALLQLEDEREREPPELRERVARALPDYELGRFLGRGGMGVVFQAQHRTLERRVAIKVVAPASGGEAPWVERFTREARALARLDHPNVVRVYEFGSVEDLAYLVLELVDGANLRELLDDGKLEPVDALAIAPQLCEALQYAHEHGVVHRDVKPENILIDTEGRVKIADFGLAKLAEPGAPAYTATGSTLGTLRYMAPEQMDAPASVDHRADVFSLGVVLYEMLTGHVPAGNFERPSELVQVDVRIDEVVLRALRREPGQRFQRVNELEQELARVAQAPVARPEPLVPTSAARLRKRRQELRAARTELPRIPGPWTDALACFVGIIAALTFYGVASRSSVHSSVRGALFSAQYVLMLWFALPLLSLWRHGWRADRPRHQAVRVAAGLLAGFTMLSAYQRLAPLYNLRGWPWGPLVAMTAAVALVGSGLWGLLHRPRHLPTPKLPLPELLLRARALSHAMHLAGLVCLFLPWSTGEAMLRLGPASVSAPAQVVAALFGVSWLMRVLFSSLGHRLMAARASASAGGLVLVFSLSQFLIAPPATGAWFAVIAGGLLAMSGLTEVLVGGAARAGTSSSST